MPLENLEEEGLPKNPDLRIAQLKFLLTMEGHRQDVKVKTELMDAIKANSELASLPCSAHCLTRTNSHSLLQSVFAGEYFN